MGEYSPAHAARICADSKQTAANASKLGADLSKGFILGGVSAGGTISAVASHLYRDDKIEPPLTGIYLSVPSTIDPEAVPDKYKQEHTSRQDNVEAPVLDKDTMKLFAGKRSLNDCICNMLLTPK